MQDDGKYASRFSAKPSGGLCAVLPQVCGIAPKLLKLFGMFAAAEFGRGTALVLAELPHEV